MAEAERILIVGGGIAGLSLAIALRRNGAAASTRRAKPGVARHRSRDRPACQRGAGAAGPGTRPGHRSGLGAAATLGVLRPPRQAAVRDRPRRPVARGRSLPGDHPDTAARDPGDSGGRSAVPPQRGAHRPDPRRPPGLGDLRRRVSRRLRPGHRRRWHQLGRAPPGRQPGAAPVRGHRELAQRHPGPSPRHRPPHDLHRRAVFLRPGPGRRREHLRVRRPGRGSLRRSAGRPPGTAPAAVRGLRRAGPGLPRRTAARRPDPLRADRMGRTAAAGTSAGWS